jgi:aminoglycoside phosphotransferase (APT) family kinase protein
VSRRQIGQRGALPEGPSVEIEAVLSHDHPPLRVGEGLGVRLALVASQIDFHGLIDIPNLSGYLAEHVSGDDAPLEIQRHEAGYSNETFYITRGTQQWVMRRPPRGVFLPTAHDVLREYRVMSGLQGSGVRVPRTVLACDDPAVIGAPFYLMDRVDGLVIREEMPPVHDTPEARRQISEELVDALAELHAVDYAACGLEGLGRPHGYLERQLRRWHGQLELTLQRTRPLPGIAEVHDWLRTRTPESGPPSVVHGDYKLDNVICSAGSPPRVLAILDWEMATIGDPLADLGWLIGYWGPTGEPVELMMPGSNQLSSTLPGFLTQEEMVARYEQRTGRLMRDFPFYLCFAIWKLAIILEGLYAHHLDGTAANPRTEEFEWRVPLAIERMHRIMAQA